MVKVYWEIKKKGSFEYFKYVLEILKYLLLVPVNRRRVY